MIEETSNLPESPDYDNAGYLACCSYVAAWVKFGTSKVGPAPEKGSGLCNHGPVLMARKMEFKRHPFPPRRTHTREPGPAIAQ